MARSHDQEFLSGIAERAFQDLLATWMGPKYPTLSRSGRGTLGEVDQQLPSLSRDLGTLQLTWQIMAISESPRQVESSLLNCMCLRIYVGKGYISDLVDASRSYPSLYLALGVKSPVELTTLTELPSAKRFEWYVLDVKQYCLTFDPIDPPAYIDFPVQNVLNLGLFALIWGARWVDAYIGPLRRQISEAPPPVLKLVESFGKEIEAVGPQASGLLKEAIPNLDALRFILERGVFTEYTSRLAIVGSLRGVTASLLGSSGAEEIFTYCPEALAGTANLWLFSRTYHEFMRVSRLVGKKNRRLLPVVSEDLNTLPQFFLATLYYVRSLYRMIGVEVDLVRKLSEGGGSDYSYYSSAIGAFEWVYVDLDGHIALDHARLSGKPDDMERLVTAGKGVLAGGKQSLSRGDKFGSLIISDLDLKPIRPACLFPREDHLFEYPSQLWTAQRYYVGF